ncbi:MAG: septum formation initiator family protein [Flavobacteriaceae bacterium]
MKDLTLKFLKNSYVIIIIIFVIWMIFFDSNSILVHNELNNDINDLNNQKEYYKNEIERDNIELNQIKTDSGLEKYAREKLFMKRENEEIFIIEYDTISK